MDLGLPRRRHQGGDQEHAARHAHLQRPAHHAGRGQRHRADRSHRNPAGIVVGTDQRAGHQHHEDGSISQAGLDHDPRLHLPGAEDGGSSGQQRLLRADPGVPHPGTQERVASRDLAGRPARQHRLPLPHPRELIVL